MHTRRTTKGALIALTSLSMVGLAACGTGVGAENAASSVALSPSLSSSASSTPAEETATVKVTPRGAVESSDSEGDDESSDERTASPQERETSQPAPETSTEATTAPAPQHAQQAGEAPAAVPTLPTSLGDYSESLMQAWTAGDKGAMSSLATSSVVEKLAGTKPDGALLRTACEADMCSYTTESGGRVTLTLDTAKVESGNPRAVTGVTISN